MRWLGGICGHHLVFSVSVMVVGKVLPCSMVLTSLKVALSSAGTMRLRTVEPVVRRDVILLHITLVSSWLRDVGCVAAPGGGVVWYLCETSICQLSLQVGEASYWCFSFCPFPTTVCYYSLLQCVLLACVRGDLGSSGGVVLDLMILLPFNLFFNDWMLFFLDCMLLLFLNQARAGLWLAHAWFLEIVSVQTCVCVCLCVCVHPRGY